MEWFEWAFVIPIIGWLIREIWAKISQDKFIRKQANVEHEYYQKRLLFDSKYDLYKSVYAKMKYYHGSLAAFNPDHLERILFSVQKDAIEHYKEFLIDNGAQENELNTFELDYNREENKRIAANFDMTMQKIEDGRRDFNNYLTINEFMFSEDEIKIIRAFTNLGMRTEQILYDAENILEKPLEEQYKLLLDHLNTGYKKNTTGMLSLISSFEKTIREKLSL